MDPAKRFLSLLQRFEVFCRDVIEPAVYPTSSPLDVAAFQCANPVSFEAAQAAAYSPVAVGWEWGPVWSTAWLKVRGTVPPSMKGQTVCLRASTGTEALLWKPTPLTASKGTPVHGLDVNRDAIRLFEPAAGGEMIDLYIEAACNHLFGDRGLQWDPPDVHKRWNSATPGRLERCEFAVLDEPVWRLARVYTFALQLARELPPDSARARQLFGALRRATNAIPDDRVSQAAIQVLPALESAVRLPAGGAASLCHAVGHAHIDTAWLWPVRETKRKCMRTFSTVLRNMDRFPEYRFLCSQAQQYDWLERGSPELFAEVKHRVSEGRWEPGGAMWVEPDCTCPSGESLIRQILVADRYWRSQFGDVRGRQRFLYLPDTFGFPAQLPQIMRLCGLDTFITNKLHWNDTNIFPHTTFIWRGLDGSEVLAHQTPGMDYNATNTPKELLRGETTHKNKDLPSVRWLQPFGFGDGGGGPTDWNILNGQLSVSADGLPRVQFSSVSEFCELLHRDVSAAQATDPASVPLHDGELYLELHRGTYTTHARIKQENAECEELLRQAEILAFAGPTRMSRDEELSTKSALDKAWKLLLLNQFHDILPGSSISWVYEDARKDYAEIRRIATPIIDSGMSRWASTLWREGLQEPVCLFNLSRRSGAGQLGVVDGNIVAAHCLGPAQTMIFDRSARPDQQARAAHHRLKTGDLLTRRGLSISSERIRVTFDDQGRITELQWAHPEPAGSSSLPALWESCVRACPTGSPTALNQLMLYEDRPRMWDAWDIDREYSQKGGPLDGPVRSEIVHDDPLRMTLRFTRSFGRGSSIAQEFTLLAGDQHLTVHTRVEWNEEHRLLRVQFPIADGSDDVELGTQFGTRAVRSLLARAGPDAAFEVPCNGPIRINPNRDHSLGLYFPDRYGVSVARGVLGVSLLRSPRYPDATADIGLHEFRYAIGRGSSWDDLGSPEGLLKSPLRACPRPANAPQKGVPGWAPFETLLAIEAAKLSEDGQRLIVRLAAGARDFDRLPICWRLPIKHIEPVEGLEHPCELRGFSHDYQRNLTTFDCRAFQIVTFAVTRAD